MKLDINKLEFKQVNKNIFQIFHDDEILKFWSPKIKIPFGLDNEYDKYLLRLEINEDDENIEASKHLYFRKILLHLEKLVKTKLGENDIQFKSVLRKRPERMGIKEIHKSTELLEFRIKNFKNSIITTIEYEDKENNYLKTIFDMPKQSYVKVLCEIYGYWDYRTEGKEEANKLGLIVYINKIIVLK